MGGSSGGRWVRRLYTYGSVDFVVVSFSTTAEGKNHLKIFFVLQLNFEIVVAHLSSVHGYL